MGESQPDNQNSKSAAPAMAIKPVTATPKMPQPWLWNVVLLDDQEHSYDYVIGMMQSIFGYTVDQAVSFAETVDRTGRGICTTTHKEHAELKCEQIVSVGRDPATADSKGPMGCILEPAETAKV